MEGEIQRLTIHSSALAVDIELYAYIPPNYHPNYPCQLAIAQDGQDYFRLGKLHEKFETLTLEEGAPDTIVVGIPYPLIGTRRKWYSPDGSEVGNYMHFLTKELLPFLSEHFSLENSTESRTLFGDSLAGTVSLLACVTHSDTFTRAVIHSPYVNDTLLEDINQSEHLGSLTIYHTVGDKEGEVKATDGRILDFINMNQRLNQALQKVPRYRYKEIIEGDHTWRTWEPDLHEALQFILNESGGQ